MKTPVIIIVIVLVVLFLAKDFIAGAFLTFGVGSFFDLGSLKDAASYALSKITGEAVENILGTVTKTGETLKELLPFGK